MKFIKNTYIKSFLFILSLAAASCSNKPLEAYSDFEKVEFINLTKHSFPINIEEQAWIIQLNDGIWDTEKPIIIKSQDECKQQLLDFGFHPGTDIDFNKYYLAGICSRTNIREANKEYTIKPLISGDSKSLKFQITTRYYDNTFGGDEYSTPSLHWFLIDKKFIDCKILVEEETKESSDLMDLSLIQGQYKGTLQISYHLNNTEVDCTTSIDHAEAGVSDISLNLSTTDHNFKTYSECLTKYSDKVFAVGIAQIPYGTPRYPTDYALYTARYDRNSNKLEVIFNDNSTTATYLFVGEKITNNDTPL